MMVEHDIEEAQREKVLIDNSLLNPTWEVGEIIQQYLELNKDLIRYSNNERNIIIFAFIFQIIIFLIIQIFEITSLQREMKNKKI